MRLHPAINMVQIDDNGYGYRETIEEIPINHRAESLPNCSRFSSKSWAWFLAILYPVLVLAPLGISALLQTDSDRSPLAEIGADCAMVGFAILILQFVITARLPWIERPIGLDLLLAFHRTTALMAVIFLVVHPILIAWAESWSILTHLHVPWYIWAGRLTLTVLLAHVVVSLWRAVLKIRYQWWRRLHNIAALSVLGLGFAHACVMGSDSAGLVITWSIFAALALGCWLYARVIRPRLLANHAYQIVSIKPEAPRVWTLTLEPQGNSPLRFAPGQFQFLRLHGAGISHEEHPFTIASAPTDDGSISLTIKESGDFTDLISRVRVGDRATVHGPFGKFSYHFYPQEDDLVFVAGGVGITPFMSMLRHMHDRREIRSVLLIYANRRPQDVLFYGELRAMEAGAWPPLKVIHVLSQPTASWHCDETGRLSADRLVELCGGIEGKAFYLCCPGRMTGELVQGLRRHGVRLRQIHTDQFSL